MATVGGVLAHSYRGLRGYGTHRIRGQALWPTEISLCGVRGTSDERRLLLYFGDYRRRRAGRGAAQEHLSVRIGARGRLRRPGLAVPFAGRAIRGLRADSHL